MPLYSLNDPANKDDAKLGPEIRTVIREDPPGVWWVMVQDWNRGGTFTKVPITSVKGPERLAKFYEKA